MHTSVFLEEAIEALQIKKDGKYIDATYGQGGHSQLMEAKGGIVLAIDLDRKEEKEKVSEHITVIKGNFADIKEIANAEQFLPLDGILFDLGLSMNEIRSSGKGFSYQNDDEDLDMRLDDSQELTAKEILNSYSQRDLQEVLMKFSEDINTDKIVDQVIKNRKLQTVGDLKNTIDQALGRQDYSTYARIFQALRIEVNNELDNLKKALESSISLLANDGRIVIITFHSLEDRLVKQFIRSRKDITGIRIDVKRDRELQKFERSAQLRIIQKV